AEELDVAFERVTLVSGDTARVPDQGPTTASDTVGKAGQMLRLVAAEARLALMEMAADKLGSPIESLAVSDGVIRVKGDELKEVTYAQLLNGKSIERQITGKAPVKRAQDGKYIVVGQSIPRVDLPNKLTAGQDDFLENMRLPGMVHARTVRAPMYGAAVDRLKADGVKQMAGVIAVVHLKYPGHPGLDRAELVDIPPGDVVAVVAEREEIAVRAADRLAREVSWKPGETLPTDTERLHQWMTDAPAEDAVKTGIGHRFIEARFTAAEKRL